MYPLPRLILTGDFFVVTCLVNPSMCGYSKTYKKQTKVMIGYDNNISIMVIESIRPFLVFSRIFGNLVLSIKHDIIIF